MEMDNAKETDVAQNSASTPCSTDGDKLIDVWEVWPHWDTTYDYFICNDGCQVEEAVRQVAESFMDACPPPGESRTITIKVKEMPRHEYEELTAPEP
jgi:hypothetical protein